MHIQRLRKKYESTKSTHLNISITGSTPTSFSKCANTIYTKRTRLYVFIIAFLIVQQKHITLPHHHANTIFFSRQYRTHSSVGQFVWIDYVCDYAINTKITIVLLLMVHITFRYS